jgi:hypothetical protein
VKQYIVGGLAAALMAGGLVAAAPPASAGCRNPLWQSTRLRRSATDPSSQTAPGNAA